MKWAETSVLFALLEKGIKLRLKERLRKVASSPPKEPPAPPSERVVQVMNLLSNSRATVSTRVPVDAGMWQSWARDLAEKIVSVLAEAEPSQHNTLSRSFEEVSEGDLFILGNDSDEMTKSLGAIIAINGHHEVYRKVGDQGFNVIDKTYYNLPANCPAIPIFIGSTPFN